MADKVQELIDARRALRQRIDELDHFLKGDDDEPITAPVVVPRKVATREVAKAKPVERPAPTLNDPKLYQKVKNIIESSGESLAEDEIAIRLLDSGFKTDLPPEDLVVVIYNEAINPLIQKGFVEPVGQRPNRKYRRARAHKTL